MHLFYLNESQRCKTLNNHDCFSILGYVTTHYSLSIEEGMHISSVKWSHLGHFDLEPNKHNFPNNPMGSSGTHWAKPYNNNYKNQNKN